MLVIDLRINLIFNIWIPFLVLASIMYNKESRRGGIRPAMRGTYLIHGDICQSLFAKAFFNPFMIFPNHIKFMINSTAGTKKVRRQPKRLIWITCQWVKWLSPSLNLLDISHSYSILWSCDILDETWEVRESMTKNYENITKTCWDYNDKKREIIKKKLIMSGIVLNKKSARHCQTK